ncbi:Protein-L-isoaspartate O-methyltransferase [Methylovirgula sp. HY1]|nr:Protein-L-isoaspartate O-methyltransferase [Methylovirgula sp. HY1]
MTMLQRSETHKLALTAQRSATVDKEEAAEAKAAFVLGLRARGIRDLVLLRALEKVPRETFVPHRYVDLARRDLSLPIGCGQTLSEPWLIARMIEALAPAPQHRVLEIGTGSGYATAILAELAREVLSIERFQSLAIAARLRLEKLGVTNVAVVFGDGLSVPRDVGSFDRILVHGRLDAVPPRLTDVLAADGKIVTARPDPDAPWRQILAEMSVASDGSLTERLRGSCRLQAIMPGLARIL